MALDLYPCPICIKNGRQAVCCLVTIFQVLVNGFVDVILQRLVPRAQGKQRRNNIMGQGFPRRGFVNM